MPESPIDVLARAAGGLLSSGAAALGAARSQVKPLHPDGVLHHATVTRHGSPARTGVRWLDEAGSDSALVRVSRAIGLPAALPDIHGLAIRVEPEGTPADVLLAGTGLGRLTRYVLTPARTSRGRPLTTLLPYRSPRGALLLAADPESEVRYELGWAGPVGPWTTFGVLELGEPLGDDTRVSFDPVVNLVPGLSHYGWVTRLREPAYWTSRHRSGRSVSTGSPVVR
jgi:hypothetical protein